MCLLIGTVSQVSGVTYGSTVFLCPPPLKKGAYCFATVGRSYWPTDSCKTICPLFRSVGLSVCRPSVVRSISFDPFTWSIPNLVQELPSMSRWSLLCSKVKVKPLFSAHCVVRSISFDPFIWSIPNLVQGLRPMSIWSLLIFRSYIQASRSNYSFEPGELSTMYFNPLLTCFGQVLLLQRR